MEHPTPNETEVTQVTKLMENLTVAPENKEMHLDEILLYSLQNQYKQFCLDVEEKLNQFVNNTTLEEERFTNLNNFQRKIVHQICERYHISRKYVNITSKEKNMGDISIEKTPESCIPSINLEKLHQYYVENNLIDPSKIVSRNNRNNHNNNNNYYNNTYQNNNYNNNYNTTHGNNFNKYQTQGGYHQKIRKQNQQSPNSSGQGFDSNFNKMNKFPRKNQGFTSPNVNNLVTNSTPMQAYNKPWHKQTRVYPMNPSPFTPLNQYMGPGNPAPFAQYPVQMSAVYGPPADSMSFYYPNFPQIPFGLPPNGYIAPYPNIPIYNEGISDYIHHPAYQAGGAIIDDSQFDPTKNSDNQKKPFKNNDDGVRGSDQPRDQYHRGKKNHLDSNNGAPGSTSNTNNTSSSGGGTGYGNAAGGKSSAGNVKNNNWRQNNGAQGNNKPRGPGNNKRVFEQKPINNLSFDQHFPSLPATNE